MKIGEPVGDPFVATILSEPVIEPATLSRQLIRFTFSLFHKHTGKTFVAFAFRPEIIEAIQEAKFKPQDLVAGYAYEDKFLPAATGEWQSGWLLESIRRAYPIEAEQPW